MQETVQSASGPMEGSLDPATRRCERRPPLVCTPFSLITKRSHSFRYPPTIPVVLLMHDLCQRVLIHCNASTSFESNLSVNPLKLASLEQQTSFGSQLIPRTTLSTGRWSAGVAFTTILSSGCSELGRSQHDLRVEYLELERNSHKYRTRHCGPGFLWVWLRIIQLRRFQQPGNRPAPKGTF